MTHPPPPVHRAVLGRFGLLLAGIALVAACTSAQTPSIALDVDDATPSVIRGDSVQVVVDLTRLGGASASVALSVTGLPANVTATFDPPALAGAATQSTLTLLAAAAAIDGTAVLTVTGTTGTLSDAADLTLDVASLTVSGRVEQPLRRPLIGATVASQGETSFTDGTGAFTLAGLSLPYDLVVSSAAGAGALHVYEGLTSATPLLRPTFAALGGLPLPGAGATINGSLTGGALGVDEVAVVCVEGLAFAVSGCDRVLAGESTYSVNATWFDAAAASVRLHAFHLEVAANDVPTAYLGYETILLNLTDGVLALANLVFDPVEADTLTGTTSHPAELPDTVAVVLARFGPNLSVPLVGLENPGATFEALVPVLPGLSYDVVFVGAGLNDDAYTWKHDVGLDAGAFAVAVPTQLVAPADAVTGVDLSTSFSSTAVGAARTYVWVPDAAGPVLARTTTRTSVTVPDPALGGFAFPAGAAYGWALLGHGDDDVDAAAAGGYTDLLNVIYAFSGVGGPGPDGDRSVASPGNARDFTFAP